MKPFPRSGRQVLLNPRLLFTFPGTATVFATRSWHWDAYACLDEMWILTTRSTVDSGEIGKLRSASVCVPPHSSMYAERCVQSSFASLSSAPGTWLARRCQWRRNSRSSSSNCAHFSLENSFMMLHAEINNAIDIKALEQCPRKWRQSVVVLVSARVGGMAIFSNKFQNLIYVVKLDDNKYFVIPNVFFLS